MSRSAVVESPVISMETVRTEAFTKYIRVFMGGLFAEFTPVHQLKNQLHS